MSATSIEKRLLPIIYVRGFAGTENEIEDTVADPYMGFNLGTTKFKQHHEGIVRRHYFESPLVRLVKDFGYRDVYSDGAYMPSDRDLCPRPIVIYRYYDGQFYDELDEDEDGLPPIHSKRKPDKDQIHGKRRDIEDFAAGLGRLILRVRKRYMDSQEISSELKAAFKVHLVGHSMGGLIIRSFLQHIGHGGAKVRDRYSPDWEKRFKEAKELVDKVFTYATPHNGIEFEIIGNVPSFFSPLDVDNFNRNRMAEFLDLPSWSVKKGHVNNLRGRFPAERFFTLAGTNHQDYAVLYGWSRRLVGPMSDGLVRLNNATLLSQATESSKVEHSPRAFVHRAHSGHFGIVNSEEGYQNLTRFLFGDVRVDCAFDVEKITLPAPVQERMDAGQKVRASYTIECSVAIRGLDVPIHTRLANEGSAIFRGYDDLIGNNGKEKRVPILCSIYLRSDTRARVNESDPSVAFEMKVAVKVPEYTVDRRLWRDAHYDGAELISQHIHIAATPPDLDTSPPRKDWIISYGLPETEVELGVANQTAELKKQGNNHTFEIPLDTTQQRVPGIKGKLIFSARRHE